jgi:NADH-quinone oxidoreductase subunit H
LIPIFLAKVLGFIFLMFWIRVTLPRMRVDRLMNFAWKYLVPLAVVNIIAASVWFEIVIRPGSLFLRNWIWGTIWTSLIIIPSIWLVFWLNRRASASAPLGSEWPTVGSMRPAWSTARTWGR